MTAGVKANVDGSAAIQVGGSDFLSVTSGGNVTFPQAATFTQGANLPNTFGFKNRIINGAMMIDQRNAGASVNSPSTAATAYTLDRWQVRGDTEGVFSIQQNSSAPEGFVNSLKITVTTIDSSLGAAQLYNVSQPIEGTNVSDLGFGTATAKTVTLSFWVRSSLTGTFGGALRNSASNRSYPFTYAISVADTWEYKTVTIPGDTSGTWLTTTGIGISVLFALGAGADRTGTAGAWVAANNSSATGATNVMATLNATWYITGVQLEVGSTATSFDYRPFGTELALCQRYFEKSYAIGTAAPTNTSVGLCQSLNGTDGNQVAGIRFLVPKRATPTGNFWSKNGTASSLSTTSFVDAANVGSWSTMADASEFGFRCIVGTGGLTSGTAYTWHYTASAEL